MSFSLAELGWLSSHPDAAVAVAEAEGMALSSRTLLQDMATLRKNWGEHARPVAELVEARRVAAVKLPPTLAAGWWSDKDAAQQSTPFAVADFRARYLRGLGFDAVSDITCSVGTELVALAGAGLDVVGSDLDPVRVAMAQLNCPGVEVDVRNALEPSSNAGRGVGGGARVLLADPARRNSSGRVHRMSEMEPPVDELLAAHPGAEFMIKLAPGVDFTELAGWAGQVDVISLDGAAKEACALTPGLATREREGEQLLRRAVLLRSTEEGYASDVLGSWEEQLSEEEVQARAGQPGTYIVEPDAAVIRAGLVRHFAAREGLWLLDPNLAYATGDRIPAGMRGFEVLEAVPAKRLRAALKPHAVGRLEILVRGADINPDQLRKKLKPKGPNEATVVIARLGGRGRDASFGAGEQGLMAYICRAHRSPRAA